MGGLTPLSTMDTVHLVSCSSDGVHIASASIDNTMQLWNASNGPHIRTLKGHTNEVYSVTFSPDNTQLALTSLNHSISIWDVEDSTCQLNQEALVPLPDMNIHNNNVNLD